MDTADTTAITVAITDTTGETEVTEDTDLAPATQGTTVTDLAPAEATLTVKSETSETFTCNNRPGLHSYSTV